MLRDRVRLAESRTVNNRGELRAALDSMLGRFDKVVLKPVSGGSSRGLFFLRRGEKLERDISVPYLVEEFVAGRELTVGVADVGDGPFVLPPIEIEVQPGAEFNYEGKYLGRGTREICPAQIPDAMREEAQQIALAAHTGLGCEGYSRTDVIAADENHVYFLELNTLPGLTAASLIPQELQVAGIPFRDFLENQIELARQRIA